MRGVGRASPPGWPPPPPRPGPAGSTAAGPAAARRPSRPAGCRRTGAATWRTVARVTRKLGRDLLVRRPAPRTPARSSPAAPTPAPTSPAAPTASAAPARASVSTSSAFGRPGRWPSMQARPPAARRTACATCPPSPPSPQLRGHLRIHRRRSAHASTILRPHRQPRRPAPPTTRPTQSRSSSVSTNSARHRAPHATYRPCIQTYDANFWRDTLVSCAGNSSAYICARESRISSAVLVQMNGLGSSFQSLIQARMSASRAWTLLWTPRRISLVGEEPEPAFDLVDPGRAGRGEVQVEAGVPGQPVLDRRGLVGGVVVADQVDVQVGGHGLVDRRSGTS